MTNLFPKNWIPLNHHYLKLYFSLTSDQKISEVGVIVTELPHNSYSILHLKIRSSDILLQNNCKKSKRQGNNLIVIYNSLEHLVVNQETALVSHYPNYLTQNYHHISWILSQLHPESIHWNYYSWAPTIKHPSICLREIVLQTWVTYS